MENKEKKESFQRNQNKFEFFFFPQTVAGDIGRFILGSIILLVNLGALGLVLIGLAAIFDSNTPGTGTAIILLLVAILIFVVLPGIGLLAIYLLVRRLKIVFFKIMGLQYK